MEETDWRFKIAHREAWIGVGLALFNFVWWFGFAYGMGSRPVEEYSYVFGLPDWFFYSCVVGFLLIAVLVIVIVKFFFVEVPFEEEEDSQ
ncbi:DUF997 family protein [Planococcus sp. CPCC 101016]|uniref:YhdT family protein n=1 Tax=Planococcus sp. CPCC 101016 TaxID=2599617 RepID=UPI0011B73B05|nr:YhdT family protein [Planococcus sp. CPCC 101016]TWT06998.1 DUF997 family protein [Planococcus sp. CPCC 101016]